ncbi:hypothetical protein J6590_026602 [Homalodisca vitripennis]|nr:hypothetical protein J6590_026602 [Homalodisca vitripennis]
MAMFVADGNKANDEKGVRAHQYPFLCFVRNKLLESRYSVSSGFSQTEPPRPILMTKDICDCYLFRAKSHSVLSAQKSTNQKLPLANSEGFGGAFMFSPHPALLCNGESESSTWSCYANAELTLIAQKEGEGINTFCRNDEISNVLYIQLKLASVYGAECSGEIQMHHSPLDYFDESCSSTGMLP